MPTNVMAATRSLTPTTSTKQQVISSDLNTWYKLNTSGEGYLTITLPKNCFDNIRIYDASKESYKSLVGSTSNSVTYKYAVSKGAIYIKCTYYANSKYREYLHYFTYKFTSVSQKKNFSKGTACSLSKNTFTSFYQTPDYCYKRWYKISTSKSQEITVYIKSNSGYDNVPYLYNSKGERIKLDSSGKSGDYYIYKTQNNTVVKKGTYYIVVGDAGFGLYGTITTLRWK